MFKNLILSAFFLFIYSCADTATDTNSGTYKQEKLFFKSKNIYGFENLFDGNLESQKDQDAFGILHFPDNYDVEKKEKAPMILWAYPREFKDRNSASQSNKNANRFTSPYYGSMVYWVTKGYVVSDDASFPIIGEGDEEPNDSFRKQLVANGKAAIDAVDKMGYIDRSKVAVGGHSYGAFMVANLLSHSDLFAAGIARSGAYNRTLTPFGFQSEERSYWEAPNTYYSMSPFMHADKMKTPLLLIHGEDDNNSGTYPMQRERYSNALKGLGATVRLVMLPKESGLSFASKLRASNNTPILMLSAMSAPRDRIKGLKTGVDEYLAKPFEPEELFLRIKNLLERDFKTTN